MTTAEAFCPDEETILGFIQGRLSGERRAAIETHVAACEACTDLATWAAAAVATDNRTPGREGWPLLGRLAPGSRVDRYQILGAIGRGGMGEVYAAYHPDLDRRIALKVVYGSGADNPVHQGHLLREARIIARLHHPNIVTVYDAGIADDQVYVAMEFVDGQTVDAWLRERPRTWREILQVFIAAGRGLCAAHDAKVVHRDFKPQNVMLDRDGQVRVMDFGVARPLREVVGSPGGGPAGDTTAMVSTTIGAAIGTPAYMAPEQLRGEKVDVRADLYSFCVALHEALYGSRPSASPAGSAATRTRGRPIPPWVKAIVERGLRADRERRFPSMHALLQAIERGRTRVRHQMVAAGAGLALLLTGVLAWRASQVRRFTCVPPNDRIAAAWPATEAPGNRRAAIHHAVLASGLSDREIIWTRVQSALDAHVASWAAMYQGACEATNVHGDQSAEVLDLRMTCLSENLDEVRSYTETLVTAQRDATSRAVAGVHALDPVRACADVKNLRLQVPLPTDERLRATVERLQHEIKDANVLLGLYYSERAEKSLLRIAREAREIPYRSLLADTLDGLGVAQADNGEYVEATRSLQEALVVGEAARDDLAVGFAADALGSISAIEGRFGDANRWLAFSEAVVQRLHAEESLLESWLLTDRGNLYQEEGERNLSTRMRQPWFEFRESPWRRSAPALVD